MTDMFREDVDAEYDKMRLAITKLQPLVNLSHFSAKDKWQNALEEIAENNQWSLEHHTAVLEGNFYIIVEVPKNKYANQLQLQLKEEIMDLNKIL